MVRALLVFALFSSSGTFLLLLAWQRGTSKANVIGLYVLHDSVYALSARPLGYLADRLGPRRLLLGRLLTFAAVALTHNGWAFAGLFVLYGLYAASTEGVTKASG